MQPNTENNVYGLSANAVEKIRAVLQRHPTIEQAILYGSRAKGTYEEGSDIDLTLLGKDLNYAELGQIENELDDLLLPYTIDLSLYEHIANPDLLVHIKRVGRVFYQRI